MRDGRGAVHRGEDPDVIARGHPSVGTNDAHERRRRVGVLRRLHVDAERVVAREIAHRQIVQVNMLSGSDGPLGEADDLVVALDRLALPNRTRRDLVARRNEPRNLDVLVEERGPGDELLARDHHVIVGMEPNRKRSFG